MKRSLYMIVKSGSMGETMGLYKRKRTFFGLQSNWTMVPQFFDSVDQAMTHIYRTDEHAYVKISVGNGTSLNKEIYKRIYQSCK